jgi:hypothetical protein
MPNLKITFNKSDTEPMSESETVMTETALTPFWESFRTLFSPDDK